MRENPARSFGGAQHRVGLSVSSCYQDWDNVCCGSGAGAGEGTGGRTGGLILGQEGGRQSVLRAGQAYLGKEEVFAARGAW